MRILVVDDERSLVKGIRFNLQTEGYDVDVAYDGEAAVTLARENKYDLIVLDLMMPKKDGLQACQEIRMFSTVPVVMLTARSQESDKLMGFESGADDYITKPFSIMELKARVRALLRRNSIAAAAATEEAGLLRHGDLTMDPRHRFVERGGREVELTLKEFDLLEFLMEHPGVVYTRAQLLELVWEYDYQGDIRTVDVHVRRLREKLEPDPAHPRFLMTRRGVGYYFADGR